MATVRIGITGSGFMGLTHAEAIRRIPDAQLVAVTGGTRAARLAADYGAAVEPSVEQLAGRADIDAIIIATPHHVHCQEAVTAAEHGKHVLVEKPMATSVEDCDRMIDACQRRGVLLSVGYQQRYRNVNIMTKQAIEEGQIGRMLGIWAVQVGSSGSVKPWMKDPASVGWLLGYGVHTIDLCRWLLKSDVERVYARCGTFRETVSVENTTQMMMTFGNGVAASFWSTNVCPPPGLPASELRLQIMGETGLIDADAYGKLQVGHDGRWETLYEQAPINWAAPNGAISDVRMEAYTRGVQDFIDAVLGRKPLAVTGQDGQAGVAIALAAYRSSAEGRVVAVPG